MKFVMERNVLSSLVNSVQNVVAQRPPMPILSNILLEASGSTVTLTVTDLAIGIRCSANAKVFQPGETTLPARRFAQLLKEINASYIELDSNEKEISEVIADTANFRLHGMPRGDFPSLPDLSNSTTVTVKQKDLREALLRSVFAVAVEDMRYYLTGVNLQVSEEAALCIGTDGKRLARIAIPVTGSGRISYNCIIPAKGVHELAKILQETEAPATLHLLPDKVAVAANESLVITKLLTGEYPDVERVIPTQSSCVILINREELSALLRQVALFISEKNTSARCTLEEGTLSLCANSADVGEGKVHMQVQYHGPRLDIAFNPLFFLDILRHTTGESIYMGFQDSYNPLVLSDTEFGTKLDTLPSTLFILMPLRLSGQ